MASVIAAAASTVPSTDIRSVQSVSSENDSIAALAARIEMIAHYKEYSNVILYEDETNCVGGWTNVGGRLGGLFKTSDEAVEFSIKMLGTTLFIID